MSKAKYEYERIEITFSKGNSLEKEIYNFLETKGMIVGKGKYIKQLLYEAMQREKDSK